MAGERLDEVMEALGDAHRRQLLLELHEHNPHGELPDARRGAIRREELAVAMTHTHLPKLEEAGFVEWDPERGIVRRGPRFPELVPFLDLLADDRFERPGGRL